jgi:hypothetical protein
LFFPCQTCTINTLLEIFFDVDSGPFIYLFIHFFKFWQEDLYYPHPLVQDILWASLHYAYEPILTRWPLNRLREKALHKVMQHIHYEDENTQYICIGPVNKVQMDDFDDAHFFC